MIQKTFRGYMTRKILVRERRQAYITSMAGEVVDLVSLLERRNHLRNSKRARAHFKDGLLSRTFGAWSGWASDTKWRRAVMMDRVQRSEQWAFVQRWRKGTAGY